MVGKLCSSWNGDSAQVSAPGRRGSLRYFMDGLAEVAGLTDSMVFFSLLCCIEGMLALCSGVLQIVHNNDTICVFMFAFLSALESMSNF